MMIMTSVLLISPSNEMTVVVTFAILPRPVENN